MKMTPLSFTSCSNRMLFRFFQSWSQVAGSFFSKSSQRHPVDKKKSMPGSGGRQVIQPWLLVWVCSEVFNYWLLLLTSCMTKVTKTWCILEISPEEKWHLRGLTCCDMEGSRKWTHTHIYVYIYDGKYEKIASINTDGLNVRWLASG